MLRHVPLFAGLPDEQVRNLAGYGREKSLRAGRLLFEDMQHSEGIYLVVWGRVKIFKSSPEGREQTIFIFGPGELFCLTSFSEELAPASAMALEDARILFFPADVMADLARKEPSMLFGLLLALSRRLKESLTLIETLSLHEIPQRLAVFLLHSLVKEGQEELIELGFSQRELAKIIGATPETLSRVLRKLSDDGVLALDGRTIRVLDKPALKFLASGEQA